MKKRRNTHKVYVGNVALGGNAPIVVQSMCNEPAEDAKKNIDQINKLAAIGCEIVRMTVPNNAAVASFKKVCKASPIPVVADIHYRPDLAIAAIEAGAAKIRINPGNLGGLSKTDDVIIAAKKAGIPIRIGINAGSLDKKLKARKDLALPQKLLLSAKEYVKYFNAHDFFDIVVSAKAHDVNTCIEVNRLLSKELPDVALHLGITEAGTLMQGAIKSATGLGILLNEGMGDTIRISLTDDPCQEVKACWQLLSALDIRRAYPEIISCPTCGRTKVNLIGLANKVESCVQNIKAPIKIAVMGCIVNGPGEASDADIGVACEDGRGAIFVKGKVIKKVAEDKIVDELLQEINKIIN